MEYDYDDSDECGGLALVDEAVDNDQPGPSGVVKDDPAAPTEDDGSYYSLAVDTHNPYEPDSTKSITQPKANRCKDCLQYFIDSVFEEHLLMHARKKIHKCPKCGESYSKKSKLKDHVRSHSGLGQGIFKCTVCALCCPDSFSLKDHLKTHSSKQIQPRPYKCTECSRDFALLGSLNDHLKDAHNVGNAANAFKCTECGKCFLKVSHLKSHMMSHSGIKPYPCEICGKSFAVLGSLKAHKRIHDTSTFTCEECDRLFTSKVQYRRHMQVHAGRRPYSCTDCGNSFKQYAHLEAHAKDKHQKQM